MGKAANKCAKCGACTVVCPVYRVSGKECHSARGKQHLLEVYGQEKVSSSFEDIFAACLLCGACDKVCPRGLDVTGNIMATRATFSEIYGDHGYEKYLAQKLLGKPQLLKGARFFGNIATKLFFNALPMESGLRLRLAMFDGELELPATTKESRSAVLNKDQEVVNYFPGCSSSFLYPKSIGSIENLVGRFGFSLRIPENLGCCGLAMKAAGDSKAARDAAIQNIDALEKVEGPILVTCASCWSHLKNYSTLFEPESELYQRAQSVCERLVEVNQFLKEKVQQRCEKDQGKDSRELRVFYHDPCHLRNENSVTREPREILAHLPEVKLLELPDGPQCCGQGGLFHVGAPQLAAQIRDELAKKVLAMKPDVITTTCSGCYMQWRTALAAVKSPVKLMFLTELLDERLVVQ